MQISFSIYLSSYKYIRVCQCVFQNCISCYMHIHVYIHVQRRMQTPYPPRIYFVQFAHPYLCDQTPHISASIAFHVYIDVYTYAYRRIETPCPPRIGYTIMIGFVVIMALIYNCICCPYVSRLLKIIGLFCRISSLS